MCQLISFKTDLPFYLRLPPNWFISYDNFHGECAIHCSHRFGQKQFSKSTPMINNLKIKKYDNYGKDRPYNKYQYQITGYSENLKEEIPTLNIDRSDNGGFTELETYTEIHMLLFEDNIDEFTFKNRISNNLNHFINIYRLITQDPYVFKIDFELDLYIRDIRMASLPENLKDRTISEILENLDNIEFPDYIGQGRKEILRVNHLADIWPGEDLNNDFLENFRNVVVNKYEMPLHYELILTAQFHLKKKDYHISIILSETAFEVYIEELLRQIFLSEGKTDSEIKDLLVFNGSYGSHNNRLQYLDRISIEKFNCIDRFIGSVEYSNWRDDLYILRNDIIHRGMVSDISFEQCLKAIKAAKKAISFFERRFSSFSNRIKIYDDVYFLENTAGRMLSF